MRLRTSTHLIRTVLILISFQFMVPAFVWQAEPRHTHTSAFEQVLHKHAAQSASVTSLFEVAERETEEERDKLVGVDAVDNALAYTERISASQLVLEDQTVSQHLQELPLFIIHCTYRI
jgi:hypothetical protein